MHADGLRRKTRRYRAGAGLRSDQSRDHGPGRSLSGVGPFEAAAVLAYAWLGVPAGVALAIAIAYHAIQLIPTTILGAAFYAISLTSGEKARISKNALISDESAASEYKI